MQWPTDLGSSDAATQWRLCLAPSNQPSATALLPNANSLPNWASRSVLSTLSAEIETACVNTGDLRVTRCAVARSSGPEVALPPIEKRLP
jgi:hypothetical protein